MNSIKMRSVISIKVTFARTVFRKSFTKASPENKTPYQRKLFKNFTQLGYVGLSTLPAPVFI
jgi:hypothetical protein